MNDPSELTQAQWEELMDLRDQTKRQFIDAYHDKIRDRLESLLKQITNVLNRDATEAVYCRSSEFDIDLNRIRMACRYLNRLTEQFENDKP